MTLTDVASDLFLYLVTFRRQVRKGMTPEMGQVRAQLKEIIDEMDRRVRDDAEISRQYEKVKYILVILADEILINSEWAFAKAWEDQILEWDYFKTRVAGQRFFEMLNEDGMGNDKLAEIYYLSLCLGFLGIYAGEPSKIMDMKRKLYRMLPGRFTENDNRITPDAYFVGEGAKDIYRPVANFGLVAVICAIIFLSSPVVYYFMKKSALKDIPQYLREMKSEVKPVSVLPPAPAAPSIPAPAAAAVSAPPASASSVFPPAAPAAASNPPPGGPIPPPPDNK